ncbi:hypothetical protein HMPREF9714_01348 [Myroides odoratimimus CCUG 12901]|uniref:WG repeat-containing protein n=1 Tax=Myroides odoratimimus TaxID=76832 RepID=UPI0002460474|nr:WG repeat-containing protein [Myroides odoratimimus]EHO11454.1 hypothetical protein HMPREF9714_01348 [Myroides odoratimimus CCUG 12901]
MLYPIKRNNKYGFIDYSGNIIVEPTYEYIGDFSNNVCSVTNKLDELHFNYDNQDYFYSESSIINTKGEILFPFIKYIQINEFFDDVAFCFHQKIKKYGVIDKLGYKIIPFIFEKSEIENSHFSNGLARINKEGKFGFINKCNELIIPCKFDKASNFDNGYSLVKMKSKEFLIDTNGTIFKSKHKIISTFKENRAIVKSNKKYGFVDKEDNLVSDFIFDEIFGHFNNGFCLVKLNGKFGLVNVEGKNISDFIFDDVRWIGSDVFPAKIKKKWTLVDLQGNIKFEPKYNHIWDFNKHQYHLDYPIADLTRAEFNKKYYYINTFGKIISEIETTTLEIDYSELSNILSKEVEPKQTWDKAEWSYDGFSITKKGAIRPFYFILDWFYKRDLLNAEGIASFKDKNNLEIGLHRYMFKENAAKFLDYYYDFWYEKQHISNYQIDPKLEFDNDENLTKYWEFYIKNYG